MGRRWVRGVAGWLVVAAACVMAGCGLGTAPARTEFGSGRMKPVPMVLFNDTLAIVNEKRMQIVDTGSTVSMASEETVKERGWRVGRGRAVAMRDASGKWTWMQHWARVEQMQIGQATFHEVPVLVVKEPLKLRLPREILGLSLFEECLLMLDFPRRRMEVAPAPAEVPAGGIRGRMVHGTMQIPVQFGQERAWALMDTGYGGTISISEGLAARLPFVRPPVESGWYESLTGRDCVQSGRLAVDVVIGEHVFRRPIVQVSRSGTSIGALALKPFVVRMAPRHRWMSLERPGGGQAVIETPSLWKWGLMLGTGEDRCEILEVLPGTEAAKSGVKAGDVVVKVDGRPWTATERNVLMEAGPETRPVTLTVDRGELVDVVVRPTLLVP